jgi:2-polyprenyl-3-methyl-5-hydroxy-6-metoxy-1,4-benzoquinol methylase
MDTEKSQMPDRLSPNNLMEMVYAFQRSRVLLTAYELDLFTILGAKSRSSTQIAKTLGTDDRATDRLMNALCAIGLLQKKEEQFSNNPLTSQFLIRGKPDFMAGLMHSVHLWDTWSTLTEAVRQGKSVRTAPVNERSKKWLEAFIAAMHWRGKQQASAVVALLDLTSVSRVLDVGGGSGCYSMAFVRARQGIKAVVFDLPNVIPLTREYISQEGLLGSVETIMGDYKTDELGRGFDLVFLSAIIHSNSLGENQELIHRCADALKPKGQIVVQDFIMDEDRTGPARGALFALNMLVGTDSGDTYTESEIRKWMEDAGLSDIIRKETNLGTHLMIGKKGAR